MLSTEVVNAAYEAVFRAEPNEAQSIFYSANFDNIDAAVSAMVSAAPNTSTLIEYYQVYFGRLPDAEGLDFWVGQLDNGLTEDQLNEFFFESGEFASTYEGLTDTQIVTALYQQVLGREPDAEGLDFWVGQLSDGLSLSDIAQEFATADETSTTFRPLVENYLTALANGDEIAAGATVFDFPDAGAPIGDDATRFGVEQDTLDGDGSDNVFNAPITQTTDGSGAVTNTFESGDVFNGGGGTDTLNADLTATVTGGVPVGPAISTTSTSVENMFFRTQHDSIELSNNLLGLNGVVNGGNGGGIGLINSALFASIPSSTIDAQNNDGVQQLWSVDARADLVIEDVREAPSTVTEGFRDSDPGVSYAVFFDPASLNGDLSNSTLNLFLDDANRADLSEFPVDGVVFTLNGTQQQLRISRDDAATDSYDGFAAALQAAIDADESGALDGVQAVANAATSTILLTDSNGGIFAPVSYTFVDDQVPFAGNLDFNQTVGQPILGPITTNIVLDGVGRGQEGGVAVFGSMGARDGIEVFNVTVDDDSWTQLLSSTNNILETVNIVNGDTDGDGNATGDLNIGIGTGANDFAVSNTGFNFPLTDDDRVTFGFDNLGNSTAGGFGGITDVQTLDATGFANNLKVAARLTDASINKYLVDAADPVTFQYDLADSASNLTIGIDSNFSNVLAQLHTGAAADAADNVINITGDSDNDRINLTATDGVVDLRAISIDGNRNTPNTGTDINTLELSGILAGAGVGGTAFNSVDDIDNLILAGNANVAVDVTGAGFVGLDTITVKTGGPGTDTAPFANAIIQNAEAATDISIDGGNQVLGGANGPLGTPVSNANAAQNFGVVTINNNPNTTLDIDLDNAANSNGILTVNDLVIGTAAGGTSNVGTVNLSSNGVNGTSNVLGSAAGAGTNGFTGTGVGTLNFVGTQDLTATVLNMAAGGAALISGAGLSGDLNLTVAGPVLNNTNTDQVIGTAGGADVLNLRGAFGAGTETRISAFETLNFLNASGTFDATNVVGLDTVSINGMTADFALSDLADGLTVNVQNDGGVGQDLSIDGRGSGSVTVNLAAGANNLGNAGAGQAQLSIAEVDNATVNVAGTAGGANVTLDLLLDNQNPMAAPPANVDVDNIMDNITITSTGNGDVTFSNPFANTLDTIDLSGIGGDTIGVALFDADPTTATQDNDDTTIVLNGEGGDFTLIDNDANPANAVDASDATVFNDNVIFQFSAVNTNAAAEVYTINNFVAFDGTNPADQTPGANNSNRSVLDLTAFGLTSTADLDIDQVGANTEITLDGGNDPWQIVLTNTMADGLGDENFIF